MPRKLTYEYVKNYIENNGYILLSSEYINTDTKLLLKCPENHIFEMCFNLFRRGQRCSICTKRDGYKNTRHSYEYVKEYIEKEGYTLLSEEYVNSHTKLKIKCINGHKYDVIFNSFRNGFRCPICSYKQKHSYEYVKEYIEKEGYTLLSEEYVNSHTKLKIKCINNHIYYQDFNVFQQGCRCPKCSNKISKQEKIIVKYIKSIYKGKIIENDRKTILNPLTNRYLELDVYLPEIKKAIEFNGEHWHDKKEIIIRDTIKNDICEKVNINLMTIWFNDWIKKEEKILTDIKTFIGDN